MSTAAKLIAEYHTKLINLENEIAICTQAIRDFRATGSARSFFNEETARDEKRLADAKRQQIVQFIKDLEDLV